MQRRVQIKSRAWMNVLPPRLHFMDKINQNGELTIFKRCSHRPAEGKEINKIISKFQTSPQLPMRPWLVENHYHQSFKDSLCTDTRDFIYSAFHIHTVCVKGPIKTAADTFYISGIFAFDFELGEEHLYFYFKPKCVAVICFCCTLLLPVASC